MNDENPHDSLFKDTKMKQNWWQYLGLALSVVGLLVVIVASVTRGLSPSNVPQPSTVDHSTHDTTHGGMAHDVMPFDVSSGTDSISFFVLLTTGLLAGLSHCVGMCGPLVSGFVMRRRAARLEVTSSLIIFQSGRLATYTLIGLLMGLVGSVLHITAFGRGWQVGLSLFLGVVLLLVGLNLLGVLPKSQWLASAWLAKTVAGWMRPLLQSKNPAAPFVLGMSNGLLPCGPVYGMALVALSSGNPVSGALFMLVFGLGTLPAMLGIGFVASRLSLEFRTHLYRVTAVLIILVGLQLTLRGLALGGIVSHTMIGEVMLW